MDSKSLDDIGNICVTIRLGERIQIGEDAVLQVISSGGRGSGKGVRLRITAPRRVKVIRLKKEEKECPNP